MEVLPDLLLALLVMDTLLMVA